MNALLETYGWNEVWANAFAQTVIEADRSGLVPGRVVDTRKGSWRVMVAGAKAPCEVGAVASGSFLRRIERPADMPTTGDWVALSRSGSGTDPDGDEHDAGPALVHGVLPRSTRFSRKAPGETAYDRVEEQVLVANVDTAFIVVAAGHDWNLRRIERYLALVADSGSTPVLVVTKCDLEPDPGMYVREAGSLSRALPVVAVSARTGFGMDDLESWLRPGRTVVLLGSSGAGKSTLLNTLAGERLREVREVREDDHRGRHTTSSRTLFRLASGALVIDTPGLREIQLWIEEEDVDTMFAEIEALVASCRFRDCGHENEPGCAVTAAAEAGTIDPARLASWRKLRNEARYLRSREDPVEAARERARWRTVSKRIKAMRRGE